LSGLAAAVAAAALPAAASAKSVEAQIDADKAVRPGRGSDWATNGISWPE
jgi:hypothetical protein